MNIIEQLRQARDRINAALIALEGTETEQKMSETLVKIDLTPREKEIFELMGQGITPRNIADSLKIALKTVEAHRENIRVKFGAKSAFELQNMAKEALKPT